MKVQDLEKQDFTFDAHWFLARGWKGIFAALSVIALILGGFNVLGVFLEHPRVVELFGNRLTLPELPNRAILSPHWLVPVLCLAILTVANRLLAWFTLKRIDDLKQKRIYFEVFVYAGELLSVLAMKFSGGVESPMVFYFLAHTVVIASVLSRRSLAWHIAFMSVLFSAVSLSEFTGLVPHTDLTVPPLLMYRDVSYVFFVTLSVIGYMVYIGLSSWNIFRKMNERRKALAEALAAKRDAEFYQDLMQHDLTNYNHTLMGNLSLLQKSTLDENQKRYVTTCLRQAVNSDRLITRAQAFAWVGNLKSESFQSVDLCVQIQDAAKIVKAYYVGREIHITMNMPEMPCPAQATELLNAALINILDNAVKHNPRTPVQVTLGIEDAAHNPDRFWQISVADNGPGIFDEMKRKIFERYAAIGTEKHTGLGLSLCRTIIEKHGGRVWVQDRVPGSPDQGCVFAFTIPKD